MNVSTAPHTNTGKDGPVPQQSPRTYLLMSAAIVGALVGSDLVKLATTGRIPPSELRHTAFAAATLLAALGLTSRHTLRTLELARRIEHARSAGHLDARPAAFPVAVRANGAPVRQAGDPASAMGSTPPRR